LSRATEIQPTPNGVEIPILDLVLTDFKARAEIGLDKYGEYLKPFNGRSALTDAYQEAIDLCMYLRQKLYEEDGK
jgi:hypothetical protein